MSKPKQRARAKNVPIATSTEETAALYSIIAAKAKASIDRAPTAASPAPAVKQKRKSAKRRKKAATREGKRGIVVHVPHEMGDALKRLADQMHVKLEALAFEALNTLLASHKIAPFLAKGVAGSHDDEGRAAHVHG